jgi:hypothetical protein
VAAEGEEAKTNPIELSDLISAEYETKARNKPKGDIPHDIKTLQRFRAHFPQNMYGQRVYGPFPIRWVGAEAGGEAKPTQVG